MNFGPQLASLYVQFTAWLVRVDSFATSQASFTGIDKLSHEKAQAVVEDRISQRVTLMMNGLIIASLDNATAPSPTLDQLASAASLSVNHFIRAFRQQNGMTPHRYVVLRRLERGIAMLKKPGTSVADVAEILGFTTPAHFVATFRRMMGVTPGAFRTAVLS